VEAALAAGDADCAHVAVEAVRAATTAAKDKIRVLIRIGFLPK
jgi:hypothetical protein